MQLLQLDGLLIGAAWQTALLKYEAPTLDDLLAQLPGMLSTVRAALRREPSAVSAVAGLTGVRLPPATSLETGLGLLRSARPRDHPAGLRITERTGRVLDDGTQLVIEDRGDVVFETRVPYAIRVVSPEQDVGGPANLTGYNAFQDRLQPVQLAFLLASDAAPPPVVAPTWQRVVDPLLHPGNYGIADIAQYAQRTPTQLTIDEAERWAEWADRLANADLSKLSVATSRLVQAAAQRKVHADSLIDAVIAWEAMFGSRDDTVLRITSSMAKLLADKPDDRRTTKSRLAKIYGLRSQLIHGRKPPSDAELVESAAEAVRHAASVMRALVRDRPDLLAMASEDRSNQLLLE